MSTNENISITITESGSRRVKSGLDDIGHSALGAESALELLKHTLGALGFAEALHKTIEMADEYTNLQNQIRQVTDSTAMLNVVTDRLVDSAAETRTSLEGTVTLYRRLARTADELGLSQNNLLDLTKSITQAVALSGASSQEASSGIIQLGHALGLGQLRGRQLISVLEEVPGVAQVIADGMGVDVTKLHALAAAGKITSEVIVKAFEKAKDSLDERFSHTVVTVSQAVEVLTTRWVAWLGKFNTSNGLTATLAQGILFLANNMDTLARSTAVLAITWALLSSSGIPALISQIGRLFALIALNPMTTLTIAIVAAGAAIVVFGDQIDLNEGKFITMRDVSVAVWNDIKDGANWLAKQLNSIFDFIGKVWGDTTQGMNESHNSFIRTIAIGLDNILRMFTALALAIVDLMDHVWTTLKGGFDFAWQYMKAKITGSPLPVHEIGDSLGVTFADSIINGFVRGWDSLGTKGPIEKAFDGLVNDAQMIANTRLERQMAEEAAQFKAKQRMAIAPTATATHEDPKFDQMLAHLKAEGDLLKLNRLAREQANVALTFEQKLKRELTPQEFQLIAGIVAENDGLKQRSDVLEGLQANTQDFLDKQKAINAVMQEAPALTEALTQELAKLEIQMLQAQQGGSFVDGYIRQLRIMQLETRNAVSDIGASFASIFGPGGSLSKGLGDAIAHAIVFKESFAQAVKSVAQTILTDLISSIIQLGINMALNAALGSSLAAAAAVSSVTEAAAVTAAWGPAATLVNAATFGAGSAAGTAALASSLATIKALSTAGGFAAGGYTGDGSASTIAGVVHKGEFVYDAASTRRIGRGTLESIRNGGNAGGSTINVTAINQNVPGMTFETQQVSPNDIRIIARQEVHANAGKVIANEIANPSSKTSRSLGTHTTAGRRRA